MMRNSEIVTLVETVNDVLQSGRMTDDDLAQITRWAQMGIDETGSTLYRIVQVLAVHVAEARDGLSKLVAASSDDHLQAAVSAKMDDRVAASLDDGVSLGEPMRSLSRVDDDGVDDGELTEDDESLGQQLATSDALPW